MYYRILDEAIRWGTYLLSFVAAFLIVYPLIGRGVRKQRSRSRFSDNDTERQASKPRGRWFRELELFLITTMPRAALRLPETFIVFGFLFLSLVVAAMAGFFLFETGSGLLKIVIGGVLVGSLPGFMLYVRRENIRIGSSYEGDGVVTELIANYKLNHFNMMEAIDRTIFRIESFKYSKRVLRRLSMQIKESGSAEEIEKFTEEFAYAYGTNWSQMLSNVFYNAIVYRDNVLESLEDILSELIMAKNINEQGNQENAESFLIIKYVAPIGYVLSVLSFFKYFNFDWQKFMDYQFRNPMGLNTFLFFIFFMMINYIIYIFLRKPKNDI